MTPDLDTLLTALYVKIDDELKGLPRPGRPPQFTDAELITVAVAQSLLRHESEHRWLRAAARHIGHLLPYLPKQSDYNKRLRKALPLIQRVIRLLATRAAPAFARNTHTWAGVGSSAYRQASRVTTGPAVR